MDVENSRKKALLGIKEDPFNYKSNFGEYFNINMDKAMDFAFSKCTAISDKIKTENLSTTFIN